MGKVRNEMRNWLLATVALAAFAAASLPALAADATFERDLSIRGTVELSVSTGAGNIRISRSSGNTIHVVGRIHSGWGADYDVVQRLAAHPPIEQTGNIVRIGVHHENLHNISIDYEVEAPADAFLHASSGSGTVTDDGVGQNAKLSTGSGSIHATGLKGSFSLDTGSGNIFAEQVGNGDVKAETGSGSIELRNLQGGLHAQTGSGSIKAAGTPTASWKLTTGSGSVEVWLGSASAMLDAETGSGSIHSDRQITTQGSLKRHHVVGRIGGGGPDVRIETGSGSIRIH